MKTYRVTARESRQKNAIGIFTPGLCELIQAENPGDALTVAYSKWEPRGNFKIKEENGQNKNRDN